MSDVETKTNRVFREDGFVFVPKPPGHWSGTKYPVARYSHGGGTLSFNDVAAKKAGLRIPVNVSIGFDKSRGMLALKPCDPEEFGSTAVRCVSKVHESATLTVNVKHIAKEMGFRENKVFEIDRGPRMITLQESQTHMPIIVKSRRKRR